MNRWRRLRGWILAGDLAWAPVALMLGLVLREPHWRLLRSQALSWWPVAVVILLTWALLFSALELDGFGAGWRRSTIISQCVIGVTVLMIVTFAGGYASRILRSRLALAYFAVIFAIGVILIRLFAAARIRHSHQIGSTARTLILGDGPLAEETVRRVRRHPELGWTIMGYLGLQSAAAGRAERELRTLDVIEFALAERVDQVAVVMEEPLVPEIQQLLERLRSAGIAIIQVPAQFELYSCRPHLLDLDGIPVICFDSAGLPRLGLAAKRTLDYCGALVGLIAAAPVALPLLLLASRRGPRVLVQVRRVGHRGREFGMWRLALGEADPNHLLCRLGLSELPQLWNVLRGEMSLVGPRPEEPAIAQHYTDRQRRRLEVLPGITGLAQVHGWRGRQRDRERYSLDSEYGVRWSLWRDVAILLQTISAIYHRRDQAPRAESPGMAAAPPGVLPKDETAC